MPGLIGLRDEVFTSRSGVGIKISDADSTEFGWHDIIGQVELRGTGANDPAFSVYGGYSGLRQYEFSASTMQQVWMVYHVPHDWVPGTPMYFHAHWSNAAAAPNTGNVRWGFEYTWAKGFNQAPFGTPVIAYALQASPATRYQHNIAETVAQTLTGLEVDALILCRVFRDAADVLDTCTDAVFLHTADVHYQSNGIPTKNKAPDFYA
jgi:hypothetical protein